MAYELKRVMKIFHCLRCGHEWIPKRYDKQGNPIPPKVCANKKCKSPYWRIPRGQPKGPRRRVK